VALELSTVGDQPAIVVPPSSWRTAGARRSATARAAASVEGAPIGGPTLIPVGEESKTAYAD
jgi:hypothetical protein